MEIEDAEEFNHQRIVKGCNQRLNERRPELFDLFLINTGTIEGRLPLLLPCYVLLDHDAVARVFGMKEARRLSNEELNSAKDKATELAASGDPYWNHAVTVLDNKLVEEEQLELLTPFNEELAKYIDGLSLSELEHQIAVFDRQSQADLPEFQPFYKQLSNRLHLILATSWFDNFHNDLIKRATKELPSRKLVKVEEGDTSLLTKRQKKYRLRLLQQENGEERLCGLIREFFSFKFVAAKTETQRRIIPMNSIEGLDYWGDEEHEFNDRVEIPIKNLNGRHLPSYEAIYYMGHDWNQYNRTRFNRDNLPPLTIRGYRFRIFYPNIADKQRSPTFHLDKNLVENDTPPDPRYSYTAIVFEAGYPYLPIAFRIVDKQWDTYRNSGYHSTFHQGVFTFQFAFKASLYYKGYTPQQLY